jgi:hypothetical protein
MGKRAGSPVWRARLAPRVPKARSGPKGNPAQPAAAKKVHKAHGGSQAKPVPRAKKVKQEPKEKKVNPEGEVKLARKA